MSEDSTREMLDKIRKLINEESKISLTTGIGLKESKKTLIREGEEDITPQEQKEEEKKFLEAVSRVVRFNPMKIYKENVEWSGFLIRERVDWVFSLDETVGCYIDTEDLFQLTDESLETLRKLRAYYDIWSEEHSSKLTSTSDSEGEETGEEPQTTV